MRFNHKYELLTQPAGGLRRPPSLLQRYRLAIVVASVLLLAFLIWWSFGAGLLFGGGRKERKWEALRFDSDGRFQVAIFEDLHFGENSWDAWGPKQDIESVRVMNDVLDAEKQQLVVLNGDLITGENQRNKDNASEYIDQIVAPIVERGLPWASTYGNHDSDFNLSRTDILAREQRYKNSLTRQDVTSPTSGVTNYYLPIYPHNSSSSTTTTTTTPSLLLWFFDSRGGFHYQQTTPTGSKIPQPNWVDRTVVDWFKSTTAHLTAQYNTTIPSLAFVHIPTFASLALQTHPGIHPNHHPGLNDDIPVSPQAEAWCPNMTNDGSCPYGGQDEPFMDALATTPGLIALFSGHDHGDTWCHPWDGLLEGMRVKGNGMFLCFGQRSGYGGYGRWIRGARQVRVREEGTLVETWIRLEDGEVVGWVGLNETFGRDWYPATEDRNSSSSSSSSNNSSL